MAGMSVIAKRQLEASTILLMAVAEELVEEATAVMAMQQVIAKQQCRMLVPVLKVGTVILNNNTV